MSDNIIRFLSIIGLCLVMIFYGFVMHNIGYHAGRQEYLKADQHLFWINDELVGKVRFDELNGIYWISAYEKQYFRTEK